MTSARRSVLPALSILGVFAAGVGAIWFLVNVVRIPLPADPIRRQLALTSMQSFFTIVVPCAFVGWRFGLRPSRLGLTRSGIGRSLLLGLGLYAIAFAVFAYCSGDPLIARHPIGRLANPANVALLAFTMALQAATADLATRGFLLLSLAEYTHVGFAILMQNVAWFTGHIYEVQLVQGCLGLPAAALLFLALGVLGDWVALRTRNVVGLAIAHVLLNLAMVGLIRAQAGGGQ